MRVSWLDLLHDSIGHMSIPFARVYRTIPAGLGLLTLAGVVVLLVCDAAPQLFPAGAHDVLAALPLVLIALAHLSYQAVRRATTMQWAKALLLDLAFLFWAANQLWQDRQVAALLNDLAIAAFVLDVLLMMAGPAAGKWSLKRSGRAGEKPHKVCRI